MFPGISHNSVAPARRARLMTPRRPAVLLAARERPGLMCRSTGQAARGRRMPRPQ